MIFGAISLDIGFMPAKTTPTLGNLSLPYMNGIRIVPAGLIGSKFINILYGDTTSMDEYETLNIEFGEEINVPYDTYISGYRYIWRIYDNTFTICGSTGLPIAVRTNIKYIADLKIDYTIFENHAFEISLGDRFLGDSFFIIASVPLTVNVSSLINTDWGYVEQYHLSNTLEDMSPIKFDNRLADFIQYFIDISTYIYYQYKAETFTGIGKATVDLSSSGKYPFYCDYEELTPIVSERQWKTVTATNINFDGFVLPMLAISMFPYLMPTVRSSEFLNNKPTYEPWMIWGFFEILYNNIVPPYDDNDGLFMLDLGPQWG